MATFLEDPRLRQRWNQISHNAEAVTENAAAGIWTFQHRYINPCLSSLGDAVEPCIAPCFGDRDDRARRARAREHPRVNGSSSRRAEYTFDFYDDWDDDDELLASGGYGAGGGLGGAAAGGGGGILGGWAVGGSHSGTSSRGEDWERLIGGSGVARKGGGGGGGIGGVADAMIADQPKRKRGMSYGTRGSGTRRKTGSDEEDPTIIPSTAPLGFLGRLPWKIGGTLRYKPSAAFLQDHPGAAAHPDENQPLLDSDGDEDLHPQVTAHTRKRSGTSGSGATSDSYRSRGDLFPSDGEEFEDAMEIDDEFAMALERVDDRASSNTRSSKGKRPAGSRRISRTVSATTLSTSTSKSSLRARRTSAEPGQNLEDSIHSLLTPSINDLQREEEEVERLEDQEVARKREAAAQLARDRGLSTGDNYSTGEAESRAKSAMFSVEEISEPSSPHNDNATADAHAGADAHAHAPGTEATAVPHEWHEAANQNLTGPPGNGQAHQSPSDEFIPARLPNFR